MRLQVLHLNAFLINKFFFENIIIFCTKVARESKSGLEMLEGEFW